MYQVVASDLDGTLLSPDHTLSPYAKETLKLLTARGINFVFATGRHHVDVGQIRDNLEIKSYMITSNGARVHDLDGNLIFAHNLDRDIASDLFGVVNDNPDIITNVYRDDEWFMNRHRPEEMRFFKEAVFKYALYEPGLSRPLVPPGQLGHVLLRQLDPGGRTGGRGIKFYLCQCKSLPV